MTLAASTVGGIEYPTFTFVPQERAGNGHWRTTDHEVAHNWFPMMIGTNERQHFWMDEGLVTFMGYYAAADAGYASYMTNLSAMSGLLAHSPMCKSMIPPDDYACEGFYNAMYFKPALGFILLREYLLDSSIFDIAFSAFMQQWVFKHPTPEDLFHHFNNASGEDLSWFWKDWFDSEKQLDQGIEEVKASDDYEMEIKLVNNGDLKFPVTLTITTEGEMTETIKLPRNIWSKGNTYTFKHKTEQPPYLVEIDKARILPDINRQNNQFAF